MCLQGLVFKFLNDPEEKIMIFNLSPAQAFMVFLEHQTNLKSKIIYFIRREAEKVTVDNFFELLQIGEASSQPLDELEVIVQDVSDVCALPTLALTPLRLRLVFIWCVLN